MKNLSILLFIANISLSFADIKDFPKDDYTYVNGVDRGWSQYLAKSLYGTKKVVLTYDDGPHITRTPKMLDVLKKYNVKATFFVLGEMITQDTMPILDRMIAEGHTIASHDLTHNYNNRESLSVFKSELTKSVNLIEDMLDSIGVSQQEKYFRFPYGQYGGSKGYHHINALKEVSQEIYGENCLNFVFWDIDTDDWVPGITPEIIKQNIIGNIVGGTIYYHAQVDGKWVLKPQKITKPIGGGIVLMHDTRVHGAKATELFLEEAKERGIKIVPLSTVENFEYSQKSCVRIN